MSISSALNAGVSGLQANATQLATISDNVANSSTYGYKRVQTSFDAVVFGADGSYTAGGVLADTQRMIDESGGLVTTKNATDIAVQGNGFLPVIWDSEFSSGGSEMLLSRGESFRINADGYLATGSGLLLMGWPALSDGTIPNYPRDSSNGLEPIQLNLNPTSDPTTAVSLALNLPATDTAAGSSGAPHELTLEYFDNLGRSQSLNLEFTPTVPGTGSSNQWTLVVTDNAQAGAIIGEYTVDFDSSSGTGGTISAVSTVSGGAYDPVTGTMVVTTASGPIEMDIGAINDPSGLTQLADNFTPIAINKDGSTVGNMVSVEVDENGYVNVLYDTGVTDTLYQVPMVSVADANGLDALSQQTYRANPTSSGPFFLWDAGDGPVGTIASFAREASNVDIAAELTTMIQTQRAYSSNAKIIQTVDEMLQETTNIKR